MKIGDIVVDLNNKVWIIYQISINVYNNMLYYVMDFETQTNLYVLLDFEMGEVIEKPSNVEFMVLNQRINDLIDIKEYL